MARKIRKDITVGALEKKLKVAPGTIKNPNGTDARSDKKLETLQKEASKAGKKVTPAKPKSIKKTVKATPVTKDQKTASQRKVKSNPKTTTSMARKISAAIRKSNKK